MSVTYLSASEQKMVARYMRALLKPPYCTDCTMRRDLLSFITDNGLLETHRWPGHHHTLSERGREFLAESDGAE